jgi:hypothetical protein
LKETKERSAAPTSSVPEDDYRVEYYYKDKEFVEAMGKVSVGPWRVKECIGCGSEVKVDKKDIAVECTSCRSHEYTLLSQRPRAQIKVHPAVVILRKKIGQRQLNQEQIRLIETTVGENQKDLDFWKKVIVGWLEHGWFEGNVSGMVGWYNRREIPSTGQKKQAQPPPAHHFKPVEEPSREDAEWQRLFTEEKARRVEGGEVVDATEISAWASAEVEEMKRKGEL